MVMLTLNLDTNTILYTITFFISRPARNTLDKVDTNKLKSISRNTTDVESISLGPKGGGFGGWGKGSAGAGSRGSSARQDEINTSNR